MFHEISTSELNKNIFNMIDKEWFLLAAGNRKKMNMMTCSWGTMGELWNKRVAITFVRNTRHTLRFTEENEYCSLSFLGNGYRDALSFCGRRSGRDCDKVKETGLTVKYADDANDVPFFDEAETVLICRKLYADDIKPENFCVPELDEIIYPLKDYHRIYVLEIVHVYVK